MSGPKGVRVSVVSAVELRRTLTGCEPTELRPLAASANQRQVTITPLGEARYAALNPATAPTPSTSRQRRRQKSRRVKAFDVTCVTRQES